MSKKRIADTYLTHDNWDKGDDEDGEDENAGSGPFQPASKDVLKKRTFKKAARRIKPGDDAKKAAANPFGAFAGFGSSGGAATAKPSLSFAPKPTSDSSAANTGPFNGFSFKLPSNDTNEVKATQPITTTVEEPKTTASTEEK